MKGTLHLRKIGLSRHRQAKRPGVSRITVSHDVKKHIFMRSLMLLRRHLALFILMVLGVQARSHAADSIALEMATGNETQIRRLSAQWGWDRTWWHSNGTHLGAYWDVALAQWREQHFNGSPEAQNYLVSVGVTPVFRFQSDNKKGLYVEAGIGLHLMSDTYNNNGHILSGHRQFGDHIGVGYVFSNKLEIGFKLQHFSNGDTQKPNNGINFKVLKISYVF